MNESIPWLVRRHHNAKRVSLRMTLRHGLVVTVPPRFARRHIPSILRMHHEWIQQAFLQMQRLRCDNNAFLLPDTLCLAAAGETWTVLYQQGAGESVRVRTADARRLILSGNTADVDRCRAALIRWARRFAWSFLSRCLQAESLSTGLICQRFRLGGQLSRWGSCNASGTVSLNYKLVFLPMALVRHVILHELAHTRYLNHSSDFWALVAMLDPDWKTHRRELRGMTMESCLPNWIHSRRSTCTRDPAEK